MIASAASSEGRLDRISGVAPVRRSVPGRVGGTLVAGVTVPLTARSTLARRLA
jgi:hypothetical protein